MKNKPFIVLLFVFALLVGSVLIVSVLQKSELENAEEKLRLDKVEKVNNLLSNYSFENAFGGNDWKVHVEGNSVSMFDNVIVNNGKYSLAVFSENNYDIFTVSQKIKNIPVENKISFMGFVKVESADSAKLEIELYSEKDSLIIKGTSEILTGTTDWYKLNAWVRTTEIKSTYVIVKGKLYGKGRVWYDEMSLYAIPIETTNIQLSF